MVIVVLPARVVILDGHRSILLESVLYTLVLGSYVLVKSTMLISFLAEYVAKLGIVGARSLIGALNKSGMLELTRVAEKACSLSCLSNS